MEISGSGDASRGLSLNPSQEKAVGENGCQLILAGPGSGKTKVITGKILHLVNSGVKPEHILALTFTDKAAGEMSDRLEKDVDTSQLTIGTFHSFCLDVLQDNILESGISFSSGIISRTSQLVWGLKNIDRFGFEYVELGNNGKEIIEGMIEGISAFRDELITPDMLEEYLRGKDKLQLEDKERDFVGKLKDMLKVYRAYEQYKRAEALIDFDDMIYLTSQLFERKQLVLDMYRKRFKHILVDEFQDTNFAQLHLVKQLAGENVCVVGDDDQSIYRFRGAYLTNFSDFKGHFKVETPVTLDVNYRNSKNILGLALQLMENAPNRERKDLVTGNPEGDKVILARCENEQAEAAYVLKEINRLIGSKFFSRAEQKEREYRYGDFAILCRRKAEGTKYYHLLRKNLIPCEFVGEFDFFGSPAIRELTAYLRATENPLQAGTSLFKIMKDSGITEVNVRRINHYAKRLAYKDTASDHVYESMADVDNIVPGQREEIKEIVATLDRMILKRDNASVSELVYEIMMNESGIYRKNLNAGPEGRTSIRLLNKFYEMCQEYESIAHHATLTSFLEYIDMLRNFRIESDDSTDGDSVKIMTVHQSKGKEFPVVFIADMATNKFPLRYQSKDFYVPNDLSRGIKTDDDEKALYQQEERRLCYVAMTRAEQKLYFTLAEKYGDNKNKTKPSMFLVEMSFEKNPLIEVVNVKADSKSTQERAETEAERRMNDLKDQAIRAVCSMQLKTAMNRLTLLEKLRVLSETGSLDAYDPAWYAPDGGEDTEILQMLTSKPVPLIDSSHTFSASALDTYDNCPMKYKLQYVLKVPTAGKTFFNLGSAVHSVVEQLSKMHMKGERYTKEIAVKLLDTFWSSDAYTSRTKEQEDRRLAEMMLDTFLEWQRANLNSIVGVEMPFQIEINGRVVKGFIDRLERTKEGEYCVIDFKTGSKSKNGNTIKEDIQMNVYALAVLKKYGKLPVRASLYYIKSNETVDYMPDNTCIDVQRERLEEMIRAVLDEKFEPTLSYNGCRFCDYEGICEAKESDI
ncbi:MAG: UvrD-helicase domain-containing protein [Methanocella sp.]